MQTQAPTCSPSSISDRRNNVPSLRVHDEPSPEMASGHDSFGMVTMRPRLNRNLSTSHSSSHSRHLTPPARVTPWQGAAVSPGVAVSPDAVDYFHQATESRHSWRAMYNLGMVAGGRTLLTLGLAGVLEGFIPGPLGSSLMQTVPVDGIVLQQPPPQLYHKEVAVLGLAGAIIGLCVHTTGLARFYNDTASINRRRAKVVLAVGSLGALLVTVGGAYYLYGIVNNRANATWEALPMRSIGNFCVYGAIPNSFSASEIVHGNIPLSHRVYVRDAFFASGGMFLMTWAQISSPIPPAPLWAREIAQCLGIICIAVGGALPRVDGMRAQADARAAPRTPQTGELATSQGPVLESPHD